MQTASGLALERVTTNVGAVLHGLDLRHPLSSEAAEFVRHALVTHGVVFIRGQDIAIDQFWTFMENFGQPRKEEIKGTDRDRADEVQTVDYAPNRYSTATWHADTTSLAEPPIATALRAEAPPAFGGDTCWASMYAAWEALSKPMQWMLDGLSAIHSISPTAERMVAHGEAFLAGYRALHGSESSIHPVVLTHPESGRKALYVSECFTTRIVELPPLESDAVLGGLFRHIQRPDFTLRWKWAAGDIAFWDNRCVQHYAVPDYTDRRVMQRIVLAGARPGASSSLIRAGLRTAAE